MSKQQQPTLTKADIKAQKTLRLQLCAQAIQQALSYYECDLVAIPVVEAAKSTPRLTWC